jgi:LCP family protein required for cell wall assembly
MPSDPNFRPTRYTGTFRRVSREAPKATRTQSAIEYLLFVIFGVVFVLSAIALITMYSPKHRLVPNLLDAGLKADRLNILLFGIGGSDHPTQDQLADSIVLISLKPSTKQAAIVSIPRDLWVHIGSFGTHRINYAHQAGQMSGYPGEGAGLLCDAVSRTFNQPIHAFVRVDFKAFEKIIDDIGGVDVYCQRSFYDFLFKDGFARGWHHLNGKRALAYARYRYVLGPEGDNFARELRQQQVIGAVRDKLQRINPQATLRLIHATSTLSASTETNLTTSQLITLYRMFHDIPPANVRHVSLKPFMELFEVTRLAEPGIAVRTRTGDNRELQGLESNIFSSEREVRTPDQIRMAGSEPPLPPPPPGQWPVSAIR